MESGKNNNKALVPVRRAHRATEPTDEQRVMIHRYAMEAISTLTAVYKDLETFRFPNIPVGIFDTFRLSKIFLAEQVAQWKSAVDHVQRFVVPQYVHMMLDMPDVSVLTNAIKNAECALRNIALPDTLAMINESSKLMLREMNSISVLYEHNQWRAVIADMMKTQEQAQAMIRDFLAASSLPFSPPSVSNKEISFPPPLSERTSATHITIVIKQLVVNCDPPMQQPIPLPTAGCIELDNRIALQKDLFELHYFINGQWNVHPLKKLQVRIIRFLYDLRNYPDRFAQTLKQIADALSRTQSDSSIWNQINALEKLCAKLGIKQIITKTTQHRYCLNWQMTCCAGIWATGIPGDNA